MTANSAGGTITNYTISFHSRSSPFFLQGRMCRMRTVVLLSLCLAISTAPLRVATAGAISGEVTNPDQCKGVQVLLRARQDPRRPKVVPASFDAVTGKFRAEGLPEGRYDLRLLIPNGMLDGVDLSLDPPDPEAEPVTPGDQEAIRAVIVALPAAFMDTQRPIFIRGNSIHARALVELIRHREFHSGKPGEIIWRVEVWSFEKRTGAWVKTANKPVVCRVRVPHEMPAKQFHDLAWLFSPDLGGFDVGAGRDVEGISVTIPQPDRSCGKIAGSVKKQIEDHRKLQIEN